MPPLSQRQKVPRNERGVVRLECSLKVGFNSFGAVEIVGRFIFRSPDVLLLRGFAAPAKQNDQNSAPGCTVHPSLADRLHHRDFQG